MTPEIQQVQDLSEQEQIRRAKLAKYQEDGRDPIPLPVLTAPIPPRRSWRISMRWRVRPCASPAG